MGYLRIHRDPTGRTQRKGNTMFKRLLQTLILALIALLVAQRVVDDLEAVQIEHHQGEGIAVATGPGDLL